MITERPAWDLAVITCRNIGFVIQTYSNRWRYGWGSNSGFENPDDSYSFRSDLLEVITRFIQVACPRLHERGMVSHFTLTETSTAGTGVHVRFEGELRKVLLEYGVINEGEGV